MPQLLVSHQGFFLKSCGWAGHYHYTLSSKEQEFFCSTRHCHH